MYKLVLKVRWSVAERGNQQKPHLQGSRSGALFYENQSRQGKFYSNFYIEISLIPPLFEHLEL